MTIKLTDRLVSQLSSTVSHKFDVKFNRFLKRKLIEQWLMMANDGSDLLTSTTTIVIIYTLICNKIKIVRLKVP